VKMYLPTYLPKPSYLGRPRPLPITHFLPPVAVPSRAPAVSQSVSRPFSPFFQPRRMAEGKRWRAWVRGSTCRHASELEIDCLNVHPRGCRIGSHASRVQRRRGTCFVHRRARRASWQREWGGGRAFPELKHHERMRRCESGERVRGKKRDCHDCVDWVAGGRAPAIRRE
jgi:hypothetical protein